MSQLSDNLTYIINNYNKYRNGTISYDIIKPYFSKTLELLNLYAENYSVEYNNIKGKPNIPFIPLFPIRDNIISPNMTQGIYIVLLVKPSKGIYISLNQGTEKALDNPIERDKIKINTIIMRQKVNNLLATYSIEHKLDLLEEINLTEDLTGNTKRPTSYEYANIKSVFYNLKELELYPEKFIRDIYWFIELYRKLFV